MDSLTQEVLDRDESLRKIHDKIDKIEDWDALSTNPTVTVCVAAYNHEGFIREALDGILMQKVDFDYEVIVKEDKSTDSTRAILQEYYQKYPDKIRLWLCKENLYSQKLKPRIFLFARGKYIANCDGDDYWTDLYKLQKQVDFMEHHPTYSLIAGGYASKHMLSGELHTVIKDITDGLGVSSEGFDITLDRQLENWLTKVLTVLYRKDFTTELLDVKYEFSKDLHLYYHLLKRGNGYYLKEVLGVYRVHEGGVFSLKSRDSKLVTAYNLSKELYQKQGDSYSRKLYNQSIRNIIKAKLYKRNPMFQRGPLFMTLLGLTKTKMELKMFLVLLYRNIFNKSAE